MTAQGRSLRAVTFDVGGTALRVRGSVPEVYAAAASELGVHVEPATLGSRFRDAWRRSLSRSAERGHVCSEASLRAEWRSIVADTFRDANVDAIHETLFSRLYARFVQPDAWVVSPGLIEAIEAARAAGARVGVLSNWDGRLRQTLAELELLERFDFVVISCEIGYEKPHPRIFEAAFHAARCRPDELLHIGDSLEADVLPARALGSRSIWLRSREEGAARPEIEGVASLTELDFSHA